MDLNASPWMFAGLLAALSIVMVVTMMRVTLMAIARPARPTATKAWGAAYLSTWGAIVVLLASIGARLSMPARQIGAGLVLVVGGWLTIHLLSLWTWLSLERAGGRRTGETIPPGADSLRRRAGQLTILGLLIVVIAAVTLGTVQSLFAFMSQPGHRLIAATMTISAIGWTLLVAGGARFALREGDPMTHQEIEDLFRNGKYGSRGIAAPWVYRRSVYRVFGQAKGSKAEADISIRAFKDAWRSGAWWREPPWQIRFTMAIGAVMMLFGGFGTVVVIGPPLVKVFVGLALVYASAQLLAAYRRA